MLNSFRTYQAALAEVLRRQHDGRTYHIRRVGKCYTVWSECEDQWLLR